ncbi:MAG: hypothetical protein ABIA93_06085 [Candidatus Woesearchaeota archaeon]
MFRNVSDSELNEEVARFEVEHEDVYHWKNFYKQVYMWLQDEGFKHLDGTDYVEDLYWERVNPNGNKDFHIWWRAKRVPGNDYFEYFIKINFQGINFGTAEVMVEGHKVSTNRGDGIIRVTSYLRLDPLERMQKHPILKHFHWLFRHRIYNKIIKQHKDDLYSTTYRLHRTIKEYLALKQPSEQPKLFHHVKGV